MKERCESCNGVNGCNKPTYEVRVMRLDNAGKFDVPTIIRQIEVCHQCMQSMTGLYIKLEEKKDD